MLRLIKATSTIEGPVFVHCHHGKHRGPAAVGVICQGLEGWSAEQATNWMIQAGTSHDYPGLFRANAAFRMPGAEALASVSDRFPSSAEVDGLVEAMVQIDQVWDRLKALQSAGWKVSSESTKVQPAAEALLMVEAFREMRRGTDVRLKQPGFAKHLDQGEEQSLQLYQVLAAPDRRDAVELASRASERLAAIGQACAACHKKFRN